MEFRLDGDGMYIHAITDDHRILLHEKTTMQHHLLMAILEEQRIFRAELLKALLILGRDAMIAQERRRKIKI